MTQLSPLQEIEAHAFTLLTEAVTSGRTPRCWLMSQPVFDRLRQQFQTESGRDVGFVDYMGLPMLIREVSSLTLESRS